MIARHKEEIMESWSLFLNFKNNILKSFPCTISLFSLLPYSLTSIYILGTPLLDHNQKVIPIAKMLATKPLRNELATRPGPGNRKLTYLSGDSVTRTLNDIFGFDGWCLEVKETKREVKPKMLIHIIYSCVCDVLCMFWRIATIQIIIIVILIIYIYILFLKKSCEKDSKGRYIVSYTSIVRVTHRTSGAFKEDCGAGDAIDKSLGTAVSNALKGSVTDAMKRASRHFGDKLGNCKMPFLFQYFNIMT